ncbi:MAG: nucleotide exchange factor GrpE [Lachnospiraceae bacterium]|nr:nucleotide exchange factor GrpE [Lachnospiraceae bacterium]MBD5511248.1 nucleotide exchange factor GrpE [Lachnospiraceae bacterium]
MAKQEKEILEEEQNKEQVEDEAAKEEACPQTEEESAADEESAEEDGGQEAADGQTEAAEGEAAEGDKGFFGKGRKKDKKEEAFKQKIEELEDRVKRQMAEFENFRKRTEKEKAAMYEVGAKSVIEKILPVVDNFERGLGSIPEEERGGAFAEGMNMIYKQLVGELDKLGVKPIEALGKEFNPEFHNAVMQVASEEYESGVIAQELQKGYTYHDVVVRHSMVAVTE